jgi:predicted CXXCH cytochrome family protein
MFGCIFWIGNTINVRPSTYSTGGLGMLQKLLSSAALGVLSAVFSGAVIADILNSAHDFNNGADLCINCHTPHNANTNMKPLWNHAASTAPYTMYDQTFSTSLDMTVNDDGAGNPTGISAACLSCHDGTVAIDNYGGNAATPVNFITGNENLGTDLTNDHPINIVYDPAANAIANEFKSAASVDGTGLKLYNGQVECATCHDVHNGAGTSGALLRVSNSGSAMCLACHTK